MSTDVIRLLNDRQTEYFDEEYVNDNLFAQIKPYLDTYQFNQSFKIMDVGGGNGVYSDRLIKTYDNAIVTLVEPDHFLLNKNQFHQRKRIVPTIFQSTKFPEAIYDVIQFNWVLHHFVSDDYKATRQLQLESLAYAKKLLKPGGKILILENLYDGQWFDDGPGRLIYHLTASKLLKSMVSKAGANTAGVGVAFHSKNHWLKLLSSLQFKTCHTEHCYDFSELTHLKRNLLGIKRQHVGLFAVQF